MITKYLYLFFFFFTVLHMVNAQTNNERSLLGEQYAKEELSKTLSNNSRHNVINGQTLIIKDKETALSVVEPILFNTYGKENILRQQPYETYFIDNHWIVFGTLPKGTLGGTFLVIISATNSKIIRLTHGK